MTLQSKQNKAYYVKLWKTHGIVQVQRGDQLGGGKTELFLDPEKKVRVVGGVGEWFVNPDLATRAVELKRGPGNSFVAETHRQD